MRPIASWLHDTHNKSRKAPAREAAIQGHRLFTITGQPPVTRQQQQLLNACRMLTRNLDIARTELTDALATNDPALCVSACMRYQSLGWLLGDHARTLGGDQIA